MHPSFFLHASVEDRGARLLARTIFKPPRNGGAAPETPRRLRTTEGAIDDVQRAYLDEIFSLRGRNSVARSARVLRRGWCGRHSSSTPPHRPSQAGPDNGYRPSPPLRRLITCAIGEP